METDTHEQINVGSDGDGNGPDWVQIYVDGESYHIFDSDDLGGHDVSVEIHDYGGED